MLQLRAYNWIETTVVGKERGKAEMTAYMQSAVQLDVGMDVLPDGTVYNAKVILNAKATGPTVTVQNAGHQKSAPPTG